MKLQDIHPLIKDNKEIMDKLEIAQFEAYTKLNETTQALQKEPTDQNHRSYGIATGIFMAITELLIGMDLDKDEAIKQVDRKKKNKLNNNLGG